jgi:hypothetical protein
MNFRYTLDVDSIPTTKVQYADPSRTRRIMYACPDELWREHFDAWVKALRRGNELAPEPMPFGHLMFEKTSQYGMIPYGCTDSAKIRAAIECDVRSNIVGGGWTRDMSDEQIDRVVTASVDAKMQGEEIGGAPFMACIYTQVFGE